MANPASRLCAAVVLASLLPTIAVAGDPVSLTTTGTNLGRVQAGSLTDGLSVTVNLGDDVPQGAFTVTRHQDNMLYMLNTDGLWVPWSGLDADIQPCATNASSGQLTFQILPPGPPLPFTPVALTIGYWTSDGQRSGTIIVDGP